MRPYRFLISLFALATIAGSVVPAFAAPSNVGPTADTRFGVAEGFRNPGVMADMNVGWERLILPWDQIQPDKAGDFSHLGQSLPKAQLQIELDRGTTIAGLFQFTPAWAAANPADGKRSAISGSSGTSPSSNRPTPVRVEASPGSAQTKSSLNL